MLPMCFLWSQSTSIICWLNHCDSISNLVHKVLVVYIIILAHLTTDWLRWSMNISIAFYLFPSCCHTSSEKRPKLGFRLFLAQVGSALNFFLEEHDKKHKRLVLLLLCRYDRKLLFCQNTNASF